LSAINKRIVQLQQPVDTIGSIVVESCLLVKLSSGEVIGVAYGGDLIWLAKFIVSVGFSAAIFLVLSFFQVHLRRNLKTLSSTV